MNLALTVNGWLDEELIFAQQLGVNHIFAQIELRPVASSSLDLESLAGLHNRIEKAGLILAGICVTFPADHWGSGNSLQSGGAIDPTCRLIEAAGAAGIKLVGLHTQLFKHHPFGSRIENHMTIDPSLKEFSTSLIRLAETAAQVGVKLAIPADRPIAFPLLPRNQDKEGNLGKQPYLMGTLQNPWVGLDVAPGVLLNMLHENPIAVPHRSPGDPLQILSEKIFLVTFEKYQMRVTKSVRALKISGAVDVLTIYWRLKKAGYSGLIRIGQQTHSKGDSQVGHQAQAFAVGFFRAIIQAIQKDS